MSVTVGPLSVNDPVWLAPMTGVSDLPFRRLVKRFGVGMVVSEMIASRAMIMETRNIMRMASFDASEYPFAIQLAGCDPQVMADAAKLNEDRGANIIDINFGCPVKKVVGGHAGSALMRRSAASDKNPRSHRESRKHSRNAQNAHRLGRPKPQCSNHG